MEGEGKVGNPLLLSYLVSLLGHLQGQGDLSCPSTVHDAVVPDQVPDDTQGVMETALGLLHYLVGEREGGGGSKGERGRGEGAREREGGRRGGGEEREQQ